MLPISTPSASVPVRCSRVLPQTAGAVMIGPAFVAASAYVDPGNFATNMAAGSAHGYRLLWVIVAASLMAVLVQAASAKLGLATGRDLSQLCHERMPRPVRWGLWAQAEAVVIATDLAEVIGGAVALNLLFGTPFLIGGVVTGAVAFAVLALESRGIRRFEAVVAGLFGVITIGFLIDLGHAGVDPHALVGGLAPGFAGPDSLVLATGIVGATVMPHAIYLHSALTAEHVRLHVPAGAPVTTSRRHLRTLRLDVAVALGIAALVNISMLVIAAQLLGGLGIEDLGAIHTTLDERSGHGVALAFALALLASGFAASSVGTYTGQTVMAGFLRRTVPLTLRRCLTLLPALGVLAAGVDPTSALILSQVVLSFGVPFALVPLLWFTSRRDLMGTLVNRRGTTAVLAAIALLITALNALLLWGTFTA
ncbi:Nramp family divalent metal transporter [Streptomyces sp. NPDC088812]|uniref:Nramp family divalent metal transporter n=1 Tax=Streptomyces sp. NPDC088812 TaxID=3365905 RepID=UPI003824BCA5